MLLVGAEGCLEAGAKLVARKIQDDPHLQEPLVISHLSHFSSFLEPS